MFKNHPFLTFIISALFPLSFCFADTDPSSSRFYSLPDCENGPHAQRVSIRHLEGDGVGFHQGYSTVEGFASLVPSCNWHPYLDIRGHVFNNGNWATNVGAGFRKLISSINAIGGINIYYDYRRASHSSHFNQLGPGLELLFKKWDIRADGYFPVGHKRHVYQSGFDHFQGHRAFFKQKFQQTMKGADLLIGTELFRTRYVDMRATAGGYFFAGNHGKDAAGGLLRLTMRITPYVSLEGQGSYDKVFKGSGWGTVALNFPFGGKIKEKFKKLPCSSKARLEERYVERNPRFEMIVIDKRSRETLARNPSTNEPINFIFVDNVRGSSDGSFEHPFATLLQAQNNSVDGDYIYVFPGDGTDQGMNQGIVLKNDQFFTGSGVSVPVLAFGNQEIPPQTTISPLISHPVAAIVTANNVSDVTIQGFRMTEGSFGVLSNNAGTLTIGSNIIEDRVDTGVNTFLTDDLRILNNQFPIVFSNTNLLNLFISDASKLSVINNTFTSSLFGLVTQNNINALNATITNNIFNGIKNNYLGMSMDLNVLQGTVNISSNTFEVGSQIGSSARAIFCQSLNSIYDVTFNDNTLSSRDTSPTSFTIGLSFAVTNVSSMNLTAHNNTISNFGDAGMIITGASINTRTCVFDLQNNQLSNVAINPGLSQTGVAFNINLSSSQIELCNNSSFAANDFIGYKLSLFTPTTILSPDGTLSGLAAINTGTTNGADVPPAKIGSIQIVNFGNALFQTQSPCH